MKVLVIGSGGREHALCWKLRQSPDLQELYCAPGNPGIGEIADLVPMAVEEIHRIADFAAGVRIDLTVIGPELPLSLGLADELRSRGLAVFGPSKAAAELESSKVFAKQFMHRHGIPTAEFEIAHDAAAARQAAEAFGLPVVLKADGLASGKGVLIPETAAELDAALETLFEEKRFGQAAERVVVERYLTGEEVSFIAIADGEQVLSFATSKDYKRIGDGDLGANTGGMGAHSPSGVLAPREGSWVVEHVLQPAVRGMADENRPFIGVLYAGLILTEDGPKVLEFNTRFGDPEAQVLMLRLESDLLPVLAAGAAGDFGNHRLRFRKEASACVVLASEGYPAKPVRHQVIEGLEMASALPGVEIFHAATADKDGRLLTAGGRVLNVCAVGPRLVDALRRAYQAANLVRFPGKVMRTDIGRRVLETGAQRRGTPGFSEL